MDRGDIWFVDLDPAAGHEQRGHRPVFVVSPAAFNRLGLALVAPVTTGGRHARHRGFAVALSGIRTTGVVLCNQLRTLDMTARNARFAERAPDDVVDEVLARVATLIE